MMSHILEKNINLDAPLMYKCMYFAACVYSKLWTTVSNLVVPHAVL